MLRFISSSVYLTLIEEYYDNILKQLQTVLILEYIIIVRSVIVTLEICFYFISCRKAKLHLNENVQSEFYNSFIAASNLLKKLTLFSRLLDRSNESCNNHAVWQ